MDHTSNQNDYGMNDIVELKKAHPCGSNRWQIIRLGMDIRIKCTGCQASILLPRAKFNKRLKKVLIKSTEKNETNKSSPSS